MGFNKFAGTLLATCMLLAGSGASAALLLETAVHYSTDNAKYDTLPESKTTDTMIGGRFGYIFTEGLFLGGTYHSITEKSDDNKTTVASYGPTLGAVLGGFHLMATYIFASEIKGTGGGSETKYKDGSGYLIDVAYLFPIGKNFSLGPLMAYQSLEYKKRQVNGGADTAFKLKTNGWDPYVALSFMF